MRLAHYYHLYAVPTAAPMVTEHLSALRVSGLADEVTLRLGVVGASDQREHFIAQCRAAVDVEVVAEARRGYEHVTLAQLAAAVDEYDAVLYAHTKGASWDEDKCESWRRFMTHDTVIFWREAVGHLERGAEAAGPHWMPADMIYPLTSPIFGGNFWWARSELIRRTGPIGPGRMDSEVWLGEADPQEVANLRPGWPGMGYGGPQW